jgi:uncharacterized protein
MDPAFFIFLFIASVMIASFSRTIFGFGDAMICMPVLTLLFGSMIAAPLYIMVALLLSIMLLWQCRDSIQWKKAFHLLFASVLGAPFGYILLEHAPESLIKTILGTIIILYVIYSLLTPKLPYLKSKKWIYLFGIVAGCFGSAYNMPGPIIVLYASMARWSPKEFRSTLQGYFLPFATFLLFGHIVSGNMNLVIFKYFLYCIPCVLIGFYVGKYMAIRTSVDRFRKYLFFLMALLGVLLVVI